MSKLTAQQCDFFRTYGFLVVAGLLTPELTASLAGEVRQALDENYDLSLPAVEGRVTGEESVFLPMMGPRTPISRALVADPCIVDVAESLLGTDVVPKPAKGNFYRDASFWHCDVDDMNLRAIKMVTYFDALEGPSGALQVMPGSQVPEVSARLTTLRTAWPWTTSTDAEAVEARMWPGQPIGTRPGDMIIFDAHLWHASLGGRDRTQWSVSYVANPVNEAERDAARSYILSFFAAGHRYNADDYPYFDPDWARDASEPFATGLQAIDFANSAGAVRSRSVRNHRGSDDEL